MKIFSPYNLLRSFGFAVRGIYYALTRERNLRIHFTAGAFALYFSGYYDLSGAELGLLILCVGFVIACEMVNTAIERTVDIEASGFHSLAGTAKDVAAGAVLVSAAASVAVGVLLFWDIPTIGQIAGDIAAHPVAWVLAAAVAVGWIILPQKEK